MKPKIYYFQSPKIVKHLLNKLIEKQKKRSNYTNQTFYFIPPIQTKRDWKLGLTDLKVYKSIFNINTTTNKFELYTDTFDEFSFDELKDELEEILDFSIITDEDLQDEIIGPRIIKAYWKLRSDKSSTDCYIILLMGYARPIFRDFKSYLRIVICLDVDDIQLILKQYNEKFVTHELSPGNYTIEDLQEVVYLLRDLEGTLQIEYDELNEKTKLILTPFGSTFGTLRFVDKSFCYFFKFYTIMG